jgi:hypothetical protein
MEKDAEREEIGKVRDWHAVPIAEMTQDGRQVYALLSLDPDESADSGQRVVLIDVREWDEPNRVDRAGAIIWNNAEQHRDTWDGASNRRWLRGLLEEVVELCLALAGLHRHAMTTRVDTIEWELTQIGGIVLNWIRRLRG